MIGMLIGVAALSAWGLYRFNQILETLPTPTGGSLLDAGRQLLENSRLAYTMQYGEIFFITAIVCVVGAVLGLFVAGQHQHAEEDSPVAVPDDGIPDGTVRVGK